MGRAESLARLQAVDAYNRQKDEENQAFAAQAREQLDRAAQMTFSGVGTTRQTPTLRDLATDSGRMRRDANAGASNFVGVQNWVNFNPALKPATTTQEAPAYVSSSGWAHRAEEYGRQAEAQKTDDWKAKQAEYDQKLWELEEQARNYSAAGMTDKYLQTQAEIERVKAEKASHGDSVGQLEAGQAEAEANAERAKATDWEIMIADQIKRTGKEDLLDNLIHISELDDQISLFHSVDANGMQLPASPAERQAQAERDALFNKLRGIYGDVTATWLEYARRVRNRERTESTQKAIAQAARDNPFWASLATIPANVASGAGFLDVAGQKLNRWATGSDVPIDYNTPAMMVSKGVNTARQAVGEEIAKDTQGWVGSDTKLGNLYSGGYQLLMSMADSGVAALTGNPVLLGGAAATSAMEDARQRGASDGQALAMGLIGGVLEGLMEKHSIGNLLNMTTDGARSAVRNILKQAAIEGSEEFNTTLANTIADQLIMGDKNQMATRARELMALGYSAQRAEEMAKAEFRNSLMADALGGMVSGGVFAGVGSAGQMVGNKLANRTATQQQTQTAPAVQQPQAAPATVAESAMVPQAVDTDRAAVDQAAQMTFAAAEPIAPEAYRQTAEQILNEGIFESQKYGPALQQTGLSRGEIRQALRSVSRGVMTASVDPNVQTVLRAIQQADGQPATNQKLNIDNTERANYDNTMNGGAENGIEDQLHSAPGTGVRTGFDGGRPDQGLSGRSENVGRRNLPLPGVVLLSPNARNTLTQRGIVTVELHDSSADNTAFSVALDNARAADGRNGWAVTPKTPDELNAAGTKTYMDTNGSTGFAVAADGDIQAVFANKAAGAPKGATKSTMPQAISAGGKKLDCYGEGLVRLYTQYGFVPVARTKFNPEYANPGWTQDKGMPEIYFMMHNGDSVDAVVQKMGTYKEWSLAELDALPEMEYDDAYAYRDSLFRRNGGQPDSGANGSVGDMGAKTSAFPHEVKQSQTATNTIGKNEDRWNVPEEARVDAGYDAVTEQESLNNARMRLEQDTAGEMEHLRNSSAWNGEDVDVGMLILGGLRQKAKESGDWSQFKEWAKVVKQHGVTAGQALQAWAKYTRMTADGVMNIVAQNLENARKGTDVDSILQLTSEMADKFEALNTSKDIDGLVQMIKDTSNVRRTGTFFGNKISKQMNWALNHVAEMARQDPDGKAYEFLRNFAAAGIEDIAGDHTKVSAGKVIKTIRYNAMLSKAATVLRNLVGNGVMDVTDTFARDISVPLDMLLSTITKTRSVAVDKSWISDAKRKGSVDAFAMALMETGLDVNASGASNRYEQTANRTAKMSGGVMERLLSSWEKWTAYTLNVTDEFAKGGTAAEVQRGLDKLYEQRKIRDDSLRSGGQQEALYRTYQDDTKLSEASKKARDLLNGFPGMKDFGWGDFGVPFAKVPSNLPMRAIDYSPVGMGKGLVQLTNVLIKAKKGTLTAAEQARAVQSIGRGFTGSMVIWGLTALAKAGVIRVVSPGGTEENKDKEAQEKNQGRSGTQFNLSAALRYMKGEGSPDWQEGDELLSIGFLEPFNAHMAIAALIAEEENPTFKDVKDATFSGLLQSVSEMPVMGVIADAYDAFQDSSGENNWEKFEDAAGTYFAGQATSFIPNAIKGIAQGLDPYQRDLYTSDTWGGQLLDNVKASIPGWRNTLPVKLDSYGRPMKNEGGVRNFLNATVNPGAVTTYHEDEVEAATRMLAEDTGRTSVYAERKPPNHLTVDGEQIQLDVDQRRGYQQTRGQTEHETKAALNADDTFTGLDRALQADAFETAETYSKEVAKSGLGLGYEPLEWVKDLEGKSQEEVIDAIIQKTLEDADGYGDADLAAVLSMTVEDGLSPDLARESQDQAQAYADAVYRYDLGYTDVPDWVETAMQMTTDQQREKYLAAVAAGNYAEATYGKKYDGLEQMLSEGQITDEVALLACSNSVQDAYRDACKGKGISAEQFIDVYGHAYSRGESAQERREAGLKYIEGLNVSSTTKADLAKGLYEAIMEYIPKGSKLPTDWLLDNDADGVVYDQLTENQQIAYNTYIRGSGLEMADYMDVKGFKDADGHNRDLVVGYIEANYQSREQRRALYLAMGYSAKTIPW